jgi:hypothetical protein
MPGASTSFPEKSENLGHPLSHFSVLEYAPPTLRIAKWSAVNSVIPASQSVVLVASPNELAVVRQFDKTTPELDLPDVYPIIPILFVKDPVK